MLLNTSFNFMMTIQILFTYELLSIYEPFTKILNISCTLRKNNCLITGLQCIPVYLYSKIILTRV